MDLYTIILVDDEEEVRKSIIRKINWEDVGFTVIGDAGNGDEALELIEVKEPDVILTDIRMPYMDGLALAERIRQKYPSMKIIIFSGFDEFEYAKQAIKLNVIEYILKPVNMEELTAILKRIKRNLDEEIEQKRNVSSLRESYQKSLPMIREQFLNDVIRGNLEEDEIRSRLKDYQIDLDHAKKWIVAAVHVEEGAVSENLSLHKERELIPISVSRLIEEKLTGVYRYVMFRSSSESVIIAAVDEQNTQTELVALLGDCCRMAKKILELEVTVGVGESSQRLTELGRSFQSAVNALGYRAIVGAGGTIYINDVEPVDHGKLQFDSRMETELTNAVKFGPEEKIREAVTEICGQMEGARVHSNQQQAYRLGIVNTLTQLIQRYDLPILDAGGSGMDYYQLFQQIQKNDSFHQWLLKTALTMHEEMKQERSNTMKHVIQEAKDYIQANFQDPDLSVEKICRHLHMSPAYFSTMFKKETGQAYIAYLTQVRLNRAVELLKTTDDKTYVIADKVGYPEQNYFSYVFKKQFGVSPTKYRSMGK